MSSSLRVGSDMTNRCYERFKARVISYEEDHVVGRTNITDNDILYIRGCLESPNIDIFLKLV